MKFVLEIEMGNAEMSTLRHVCKAIVESFRDWDHHVTHEMALPKRHIRDINGNTVGYWKLTEGAQDEDQSCRD